jgi:energy-coupling factor transport system permease protein
MSRLLSYIKCESPIHRLNGATKLIFFFAWSFTGMTTFDARVLAVMLAAAICIFISARIRIREVAFVLGFITVFLTINMITIFIFSPEEGVGVYGTRHVLLEITKNYTITAEQLFYELTVTMKYYTVVPVALLFVLTTDPSEFASSLNRIGVPYKVSYATALALRYIPDIQRDYLNIANAQQARGIDLSRKERPFKRLKNISAIIGPLVFSSFDRITTISNAMELRNFGKCRRRTWYSSRPFGRNDLAALLILAVFVAAALLFTFHDGTRHYNPFG